MNDIEQQIAEKQEQIEGLRKWQDCSYGMKEVILRTPEEAKHWTKGYRYGFLQGQIELIGNQIAELRRKQDKRK